jgi:hypothetical protein
MSETTDNSQAGGRCAPALGSDKTPEDLAWDASAQQRGSEDSEGNIWHNGYIVGKRYPNDKVSE